MTIYLDSCVFQYLKREKNSALLDLIRADKSKNIYCFSEAHLFDLNRDPSDEKFKDMEFIEGIVENNCYFYDKRICFEYYTPAEYYDSFEWPDLSNIRPENFCCPSLENILRLIPLNFKDLIPAEQFPADYPKQFVELLNKTSNFYDFISASLDFTSSLANEKKVFGEFVRYLHKSSLVEGIYKSAGIVGFDGNRITDKTAFIDSYGKVFLKEGQKKYRYDLFLDMYNGLEIYGLVKGKPKKQKMMNLIFLGDFAI